MDGSFLCMCPSGQDYNVMIAMCEPTPTGNLHTDIDAEDVEVFIALN